MPRANLIPMVIEKSSLGERSYDIYSRLLKDRIIILSTGIDDEVASSIIAQLLYLQLENNKADIAMHIISPGGDVNAGFAIYDTMQNLSCQVATYCVGQSSSMGAVLLAAGAKGKRFALPSSRVMIHQPWGEVFGDAKSIEIQAQEINRLKTMIIERLAKHTGKTTAQLEKDCDRDCFMSAEEAKRYGIVDKVLGTGR
jgi:ATP-dependent Clp protease protease subunit